MSTNYGVTSGNGEQITVGLPEHTAHATAQRLADERGESVYLWTMGTETEEPGEDEEIEPSGEGYSATADAAEPSSVSDAPALDVSVTLTCPDGRTITADCTLWPGSDQYGRRGYGPCGSPLDGWMGADLVSAVRRMHDRARDAAIEAILDAAIEACNAHEVA